MSSTSTPLGQRVHLRERSAHRPHAPVVGIKLGGDMSRSGDRYLQLGERDFFAFFADRKPPAARRRAVHHQDQRLAARI